MGTCEDAPNAQRLERQRYTGPLSKLLSGPRLGEFAGRDNNFNLIRFLAATAVIWTHSFGAVHRALQEPVARTFGITAGDVAVDVFFVLSGFLVTRSLDGKTLPQFFWARAMRIYPALWTSLILSVAIVALFFTRQPAIQFLTDHSTVTYLLHNAAMLPKLRAQLSLPHAFEYPGDWFNIPLWTLPHELQMYGLLAVVGFTVGLRPRYAAAAALLGIVWVAMDKIGGFDLLGVNRGRFIYFFFVGALAYTLRNRIVLRSWIVTVLFCMVCGAVLLSHRREIRQFALLLALPYLLFWCGLIPGGFLRRWNRLGDYSYGLYIWGCPVQIALASTGVTTTSAQNFLFAMLITLPIAIASWHWVERRALKARLPACLAFDVRAPAGAGPRYR